MPMQSKDSCRKWRRLDRPGRLERARVCPLGTRSARARCSTCERKLREFQQLDLARSDLQPPQSPRLQRPGWLAIALLLACGLRRHELAGLTVGHLQQREGHWAIVDLRGKAGHVRTIPVPDWVHGLLDDWTRAAGISSGSLFRRVSSASRVWGEAVTEKLVWHVVKEFAAKIGVSKLAPHDLRRSCARLCRAAGGELEQIQFLLGHVSVQTTERYLGCTQRISSAVNDRIGIEPTP